MAQTSHNRTTYVIGVVDDKVEELKAIVSKLIMLDDEEVPVVVKQGANYDLLKVELDEYESASQEKGRPFKIALFVVDRTSLNPVERDFGRHTLECICRDYPGAYRIYYSEKHKAADIGVSVKDRNLADVAISKAPEHQTLLQEVKAQIDQFKNSTKVDHMDALFIRSLKDMERLHRKQKPDGSAFKIHMRDGDYTVDEILSRRDLTERLLNLLVFGLVTATTLKPGTSDKS